MGPERMQFESKVFEECAMKIPVIQMTAGQSEVHRH
jgi:hypothetical protein